jgi:molecular chaperone HtpG
MQRISKTLASRLVRELEEMAEKDTEKYASFWREFGPFLKEGIASDPQAKDQLVKLLRFNTTHAEDGLSALADYKGRMVEGQEAIYYVLAEDLEAARRSPHLDPLYERGIEALLLTDVLDNFMLQGLREYDGTPLRNVDDPDLKLPGAETTGEGEAVSDEELTTLSRRFESVLGDRIKDVRASVVLRNNPIRLVSPSDTPGREFQRVQRLMGRDFSIPEKIVELNPRHPLIHDLAALAQSEREPEVLDACIEQLFESALLAEGLLPTPASMLPRIQKLMEAAAHRGVGG